MKTIDVPEPGDEFVAKADGTLSTVMNLLVAFKEDDFTNRVDLDFFLESHTFVPAAPKAGEGWETRNAGRVVCVVVTGLVETYGEPDVVFRLRGEESPIVLTLSDFVEEFRRSPV